MKDVFLRIEGFFKNCSSCQAYLWGDRRLLCAPCWQTLLEQNTPSKVRIQDQFWGYFLLDWDHRQGEVIQQIMYALKEGKNSQAQNYLAEYLAFEIIKNNHYRNAVLVPVPSLKEAGKNHAYLLARTLSEKLDLSLVDCLEWQEKRQTQKGSSKKERMRAKMRMKDKTLDLSGKLIILIDDVITTGGTSFAAYRAFLSPKVFCCYALSCKRLKGAIK